MCYIDYGKDKTSKPLPKFPGELGAPNIIFYTYESIKKVFDQVPSDRNGGNIDTLNKTKHI